MKKAYVMHCGKRYNIKKTIVEQYNGKRGWFIYPYAAIGQDGSWLTSAHYRSLKKFIIFLESLGYVVHFEY